MKPCVACAEEIQNAAKLCKHCGTRQDDSEFSDLTATQSPTGAESRSSTCPVCKKSDQVRNVGAVIDSSSSSTETTGIGIGSGGIGVGLADSFSQSRLGERLQPPNQPLGCLVPIVVTFVGMILLAALFINIFGEAEGQWYAFFAAWILLPLTWVLQRSTPKFKERARRHLEAFQVTREASYCLRDDLVFNAEKRAKPEVWKNEMFS